MPPNSRRYGETSPAYSALTFNCCASVNQLIYSTVNRTAKLSAIEMARDVLQY
jgi:hypothetical protein